MARQSLLAGTSSAPDMLANRYTYYSELSAHSQSSIWLGHNEAGLVVIKEGIGSNVTSLMLRFQAEAHWLSRLHHPGIIQLLSGSQPLLGSRGQPCLVLEYLVGGDMAHRLANNGPLSPRVVVDIGRQICTTLAYVHSRGCLNNDIKPANLMMRQDQVVLIDFSSAAELHPASETGYMECTQTYCAPERLAGKDPDECSDIFSLGVTLYELLTGRHPFTPQAQRYMSTRSDTVPLPIRGWMTDGCLIPFDEEIPPVVGQVVTQALAKRPEDRFPSAQAMSAALAACAIELNPIFSSH